MSSPTAWPNLSDSNFEHVHITVRPFINNTNEPVRLLCIGDTDREDNRIHYAVHPERNITLGKLHWDDVPERELGDHDGLPDQLRENNGPF